MSKEEIIRALALFDNAYQVSREELAQASGLMSEEIEALIDFGVFEPVTHAQLNPSFPAFCLVLARRAHRLRVDFDLNPSGLALALTYLQRIEELEARLRELECSRIS